MRAVTSTRSHEEDTHAQIVEMGKVHFLFVPVECSDQGPRRGQEGCGMSGWAINELNDLF